MHVQLRTSVILIHRSRDRKISSLLASLPDLVRFTEETVSHEVKSNKYPSSTFMPSLTHVHTHITHTHVTGRLGMNLLSRILLTNNISNICVVISLLFEQIGYYKYSHKKDVISNAKSPPGTWHAQLELLMILTQVIRMGIGLSRIHV